MEDSIPDTSGAMYKDLILETIDQLRKRKARPDLERISHMVERKHKISREETRADLEKLVKADIVMKVDYKGNTSYRNAAKWSRRYMILYGSCNPSDVSRKLFEAVLELSAKQEEEAGARETAGCADPDAAAADALTSTKGASETGIEKWLSSKGTYGNLKEKALKSALNKEVISGRLVKLANGNYKCGDPASTRTTRKIPSPQTQRKPKSALSTPSSKSSGSSTPNKRKSSGQGGSKRTRLKKTPGPEFDCDNKSNNNSKKAESEKSVSTPESTPSSSSSSNASGVSPPDSAGHERQNSAEAAPIPLSLDQADDNRSCDYCRLTEECNRNGLPEDLLICKDCQAKAHPSCMDYSEDLAKRARNSPWQCIDCKTCYICTDSGDPDAMLFCDACDKGYHMNCHEPPIKEKPTGKWVCHKCVEELGLSEEDMDTLDAQNDEDAEVKKATENQAGEGAGAAGLPTPRASPVNFCDAPKIKQEVKDDSMNGICLPKLADTLPAVVPDASEWSIDDVVKFFKDVGFVQQAEVFREQEIDGKSLLLMKRSDVLTGLSLKLGPALKIYVHVQRLQTRGQSIF